MGKRRNKRTRRMQGSGGPQGGPEVVIADFEFMTQASFAADSAVAVRINPNNLGSQRLINFAASFSLFRFRKIVFTVPPQINLVTGADVFILGYTSVNEQTAGSPSTADSISELDRVSPLMSKSTTVPIRLSIGPSALLRKEVPWYQCNANSNGAPSAQTTLAAQGELWAGFQNNQTIDIFIMVRVVCEFTDAGGALGAPKPLPRLHRLVQLDRSTWDLHSQGIDGEKEPTKEPQKDTGDKHAPAALTLYTDDVRSFIRSELKAVLTPPSVDEKPW